MRFFLAIAALFAGWGQAQEPAPADAQLINNVVIIFDASGSMRGTMGGATKMDAAKSAIRQVVDQIDLKTTHVGLLVFSAKNLGTKHWVYPLAAVNRAQFTAAVNKPEAFARTPLGRYLKIGADVLLAKRAAQAGYGSFRLLVVTDGQADDQPVLEKHVREVLARGLVVDVIGVGMRGDHMLATQSNSYRRANDEASLRAAVSQVFAEVSGKQDDRESQEAFELISWLEHEGALSLLEALNATANTPIGE
ncbi:MAG: hypothetical protein ACI8W8_000200 [Rhodothermales bacterium]|jgi:hypothetical protein